MTRKKFFEVEDKICERNETKMYDEMDEIGQNILFDIAFFIDANCLQLHKTVIASYFL